MDHNLPTGGKVEDVFPKSFATGKHLILVKTDETNWQAIAIVNGNVMRNVGTTQGELIVSFARWHGKPDSTRIFLSNDDAHTAYPKFFRAIPNGVNKGAIKV
jgi:hypothetical protein